MVLSRDQIERELKVIDKIDGIFLQEKDPSLLEIIGHEARQVRKRKLLEMIQERHSKE
jgi:hypothetical protein